MSRRLSLRLTLIVLLVSVAPLLISLTGIRFGSASVESGAFVHTVLEWSAFCVALFTVLLAFTHYWTDRTDAVTPIIGMALFMAGCMDAFHTLAADRLIEATADNVNLIPFTWAISRAFNASIMIFGAALVLLRRPRTDAGGHFKFIVGSSAVFGVLAFAIVHECATRSELPETMRLDTSLVTRPWDVVALLMFLVAGLIVYPLLHRRYRNIFSLSVWVSAIPEVMTQVHMAFGSTGLYDHHFNIAHFLKIVAYVVPLVGLLINYARTVDIEKGTALQLRKLQLDKDQFFSLSPDPFCIVDLTGRFIEMNPAWEKILGFDRDEMLGREFMDFLHPEDVEISSSERNRLSEGATTQAFENRYRTKSGGYRHFVWSARAAPERGLIFASARDVTEERESRRAHERAEQRVQQVLEHANDAFISVDEDGRVLEWNPRAAEMFGWERRDVLGRLLTESVIPPDQHEAHHRGISHLLESGVNAARSRTFEVEAIHREGQRLSVELSISAMRDEDQIVINAFIRDITKRKASEDALRNAKEAAEVSSRAKSTFLANMSHELRTPLNSVIGFANLMRKNKQGALNETETDYLKRIQLSGSHLLGLINQVLDLSKIEAGEFDLMIETVDVRTLLKDLVDGLEDQVAGRPISMRLVLPSGECGLETDAGKLRQVLLNLVANALKFTVEGSVTVSAFAQLETGQVQRFEVKDTGVGIPAHKLGVIFAAFQQVDDGTSRRFEGTGLGLAISSALCEQLGYQISVQSEEGRGSTFTVTVTASLNDQGSST